MFKGPGPRCNIDNRLLRLYVPVHNRLTDAVWQLLELVVAEHEVGEVNEAA